VRQNVRDVKMATSLWMVDVRLAKCNIARAVPIHQPTATNVNRTMPGTRSQRLVCPAQQTQNVGLAHLRTHQSVILARQVSNSMGLLVFVQLALQQIANLAAMTLASALHVFQDLNLIVTTVIVILLSQCR